MALFFGGLLIRGHLMGVWDSADDAKLSVGSSTPLPQFASSDAFDSALSQYEKKEKCGIFGIAGPPDAVERCYYGLYALQHRGQESAGIAASDGAEPL